MLLLAIVAWYGLAFLGGQWTLVGPYADREACSGVVEWWSGWRRRALRQRVARWRRRTWTRC